MPRNVRKPRSWGDSKWRARQIRDGDVDELVVEALGGGLAEDSRDLLGCRRRTQQPGLHQRREPLQLHAELEQALGVARRDPLDLRNVRSRSFHISRCEPSGKMPVAMGSEL